MAQADALVSMSLTYSCRNKETCKGRTCYYDLFDCEDITTCKNPSKVIVRRLCKLKLRCYERDGTNGKCSSSLVCPKNKIFDAVAMKCVKRIKKGIFL